jgi:hypothetical protein
MHPPLCRCQDGAAREGEGYGLNYLVIIGPPGIFIASHQPRLMEGEQQVISIDEVE